MLDLRLSEMSFIVSECRSWDYCLEDVHLVVQAVLVQGWVGSQVNIWFLCTFSVELCIYPLDEGRVEVWVAE